MFDLVLFLDDLPFKYMLVEVVIFKLVYFNAMLLNEFLVELKSALLAVLLREGNFVELLDIIDIIDCEALLEFVWKFLDMLSVAKRKNNSRNVVILASSQLLANASNCDYFSEGSYLTCHSKV